MQVSWTIYKEPSKYINIDKYETPEEFFRKTIFIPFLVIQFENRFSIHRNIFTSFLCLGSKRMPAKNYWHFTKKKSGFMY